jgi:hypothetical protein
MIESTVVNAEGLDNFVQLMLTGYMMELSQCFNAKGLDNCVQLMLTGYKMALSQCFWCFWVGR